MSPPRLLIGNDCYVRDLRGSLPGAEDYARRDLSAIRALVVHHTAVDGDLSALTIAAYHVRSLGWPGIGYHLLVHPNADVDYVGDIVTIRYNVAGRNHELIGVCLPGDFTHHAPGVGQLMAVRHLLANLQFALGWFIPIVGHRDIALSTSPTACPGDTWPVWKPKLVGGALEPPAKGES